MGKTGKWLKHFLTGSKKKKDKEPSPSPSPSKSEARSTPASTPREKKRWSFRRSSAAAAGPVRGDQNPPEPIPAAPPLIHAFSESDMDQKRHAVAVAVATAAAADAAVAAAQAAAAVVRLTGATAGNQVEDSAATRIQAAFRSYLARKALRALKGLVKLQALVRGHLVRRQATATLRCMQALVTVQARARAQRIQMLDELQTTPSRMQTPLRRSPQHPRSRQMDRNWEDNVKIVEMDVAGANSKSRNSFDRTDYLYLPYDGSRAHPKADSYHRHVSPAPSALTDTSPRACSGHFEEFSFATAQSSPHYFTATSNAKEGLVQVQQEDGTYSATSDYPFFPSYMANTESSRAKARSQSAPKQRPDSYERQPSRRRQSVEGRNIPRSVRMQRSSSHVGASVNGYQYPWSIKLDRSNVSLKDSECGSTSTVLTNGNYCRSLMSFEP